VATQGFGNTTFGPRGLAVLAEGKSPQEALDALLADDATNARRARSPRSCTSRISKTVAATTARSTGRR
jgi:hypothetical protein